MCGRYVTGARTLSPQAKPCNCQQLDAFGREFSSIISFVLVCRDGEKSLRALDNDVSAVAPSSLAAAPTTQWPLTQ